MSVQLMEVFYYYGEEVLISTVSITLLHDQFTQINGVSGDCGHLTATSVGVNGTEYTFRLTLTATAELNGKMINCTLMVQFIGSDTIRVGV